MPEFSRSACLTLLLGVLASPALAQESPYGDYPAGPPESVQVTAPHFRPDSNNRLNGPLEPVSLTSSVRYDDLNLLTRRGVRTLRWRVRSEAARVCATLADAYPIYEMTGTSCYRTALEGGLLRADAAVRYVRDEAGYRD